MIDFFKTVIGIMRFEKGPEDLPSSVPLLLLFLALMALAAVGKALFTENLDNAMRIAAVHEGIVIVFILAVLGLAGLGGRIIQTMTAFAIVGTAINIFYVLTYTALTFAPVPMLDMGITSPFTIPLTLYNAILSFTILRRALTQNAALVFVLAILFVALGFFLPGYFTSVPKHEIQRTQPEAMFQSGMTP
jgi:hypothetical protein